MFDGNDDKRMQSTDSIETYVYGTSKYLKSEKEVINGNNMIKQYKGDKKMIIIGHKFLTIHT